MVGTKTKEVKNILTTEEIRNAILKLREINHNDYVGIINPTKFWQLSYKLYRGVGRVGKGRPRKSDYIFTDIYGYFKHETD